MSACENDLKVKLNLMKHQKEKKASSKKGKKCKQSSDEVKQALKKAIDKDVWPHINIVALKEKEKLLTKKAIEKTQSRQFLPFHFDFKNNVQEFLNHFSKACVFILNDNAWSVDIRWSNP